MRRPGQVATTIHVGLAERALGVFPTGWAHATIHSDSRPSPWCSAAIQGLTAVTAVLVLRATAERAPRPGEHLEPWMASADNLLA